MAHGWATFSDIDRMTLADLLDLEELLTAWLEVQSQTQTPSPG